MNGPCEDFCVAPPYYIVHCAWGWEKSQTGRFTTFVLPTNTRTWHATSPKNRSGVAPITSQRLAPFHLCCGTPHMQRTRPRGERLRVTPHSINITRPALQVPIERLGHIEHALDMVHRERLPLVQRQGLGGADKVLNLQKVSILTFMPEDSCIVRTCLPLS